MNMIIVAILALRFLKMPEILDPFRKDSSQSTIKEMTVSHR